MSIEIIISLIAALGIGGILGALLNRYFEQQKQTNEHDKKIFMKSDELLAEQKLFNVIFQLMESHSIVREDDIGLRKWCEFFDQAGNKYLDKSVNKENQKLLDVLKGLTKFVSDNFDFWKNVENPLYLKPELDPDKAAYEDQTKERFDKYQEYAKELELLTKSVKKRYPAYRLIIKKKLKI